MNMMKKNCDKTTVLKGVDDIVLMISSLIGILLGSYFGLLIVQYGFNKKISPLVIVEENAKNYDIERELEEENERDY